MRRESARSGYSSRDFQSGILRRRAAGTASVNASKAGLLGMYVLTVFQKLRARMDSVMLGRLELGLRTPNDVGVAN